MSKTNPSMTELQQKHIHFSSLLFGILCTCFFLLFSALGVWQVQRLNWKTNLITNVNQRVHLPPIKAPPQDQWAYVTFERDEYRPVAITGKFLINKNILVTAVAQDTSGYWVLTPLQTADNSLTFVNRGFIPMDARHNFQNSEQSQRNAQIHQDSATDTKQTTIIGLLRMSEKNGFFHAKIILTKIYGIHVISPLWHKNLDYHLLLLILLMPEKNSPREKLPIAGLTVVHFRNNHLVYAITWFILAAGVLGASFFLLRQKS